MKKNWYFITALLTLSLLAVSCEEEIDNKMNSAQECLDQLPSTATEAQARACSSIIAGIESSQAYVIRCSVEFIAGGITTANIINAVETIQNLPASQQPAQLMAALDQGTGTQAQTTYDACKKSGVPSLEYIAALSLSGTLMIEATGQGDPSNFLLACQTPNTCPDAEIGTVVTSMYGSYCIGDAADSEVCRDISSAISSGGGDPGAVAQALYVLLQN